MILTTYNIIRKNFNNDQIPKLFDTDILAHKLSWIYKYLA